jgi:hypothetical protein
VPVRPKPEFVGFFASEPSHGLDATLAAYMLDHDVTALADTTSSPLSGMAVRPRVFVLPYAIGWKTRFPYLIYMSLGCPDDPFAGRLELKATGSFFKIYRNPTVPDTSLY